MKDDKEITSYIIDGYKFAVNSGNKHTGYILTVQDVSPSWSDEQYNDTFQVLSIQPDELRKLAEVFTKAADTIEAYWAENKTKKDKT